MFQTRARMVLAALAMVAVVGGCSDASPTPDDPYGLPVPAMPVLTPCPSGFRVVSDDGVPTCDPWPAAGRDEMCTAGFAHFPGGATCERIGHACEDDGFPTGLPTDAPIFFVRVGSVGGDGSRATPFGEIDAAIDAATVAGTIIAVARGTYEGPIEIPGGVTVWGGCAAETIIGAEYPLTVLAAGHGAALRDVTITGPTPGVWVQSTSIDLRDVIIDGAAFVGVVVFDGGQATLDHVVVRNIAPDPTSAEPGGVGIAVEGAGQLDLHRVLVVDAHGTGVVATGGEVSIVARDLAILATQPALDGGLGRGLDVRGGATGTFERLVVQGNRQIGISATDAGTVVHLTDVVVTDTLPEESSNHFGRGLSVVEGASATLMHAFIGRNIEGGIVIAGATMDAQDVYVRETRPRPDGTYGRGIGVDGPGSSLSLRAVAVSASHEMGVFVNGDGATITGSDLSIRDTQSQAVDGTTGRGLGVQSGARVELARVRIFDSREAGILLNDNASADLTDLVVADTREAECSATTCRDFGLGDGITVAYGSRASITRFVITRNARAGALVGPESEVDLSMGEVTDNAIGASVQPETFDVRRIQNGVVYRGNARALDRGALPLPEPAVSF